MLSVWRTRSHYSNVTSPHSQAPNSTEDWDDVSTQRSLSSPMLSRWTSRRSTLLGDDFAGTQAALSTQLLEGSKKIENNVYDLDDRIQVYHDDTLSRSKSQESKILGPDGHVATVWTTVWLRKFWLLCLGASFILMAIALILLWRFDTLHHGIGLTVARNQYSWKYGPTAVLVLVIAMWSQVDKSSRLLTPWSELELGRMSSLKLDYISPMLHVVIWRAARNRHIPVLVTASGSLLLKLIVTVSTALLVLLPTQITRDGVPLSTTGPYAPAAYLQSGLNESNINIAAMLHYAHVERGLPLRNGTTSSLAYQNPRLLNLNSPDSRLTAVLDAFLPKYTCEFAERTVQALQEDGSFEIELDVAPCPMALHADTGNSSYMTARLKLFTRQPDVRVSYYNNTLPIEALQKLNVSSFIQRDYYSFPCPEFCGAGKSPQVTRGGHTVRGIDPTSESTDFFILSSVNVVAKCADPNDQDITICSVNTKVDNISAIACSTQFEAKKHTLQFRQLGKETIEATVLDNQTFALANESLVSDLNDTLIQAVVPLVLDAVAELAGSASQQTYGSPSLANGVVDDSSTYAQGFGGVFDVFAHGLTDREWLSNLNRSVDFKSSVESGINGLLAQWASEALFSVEEVLNSATMAHSEERLHVSVLSMSLMISGLILMAALCVVLATMQLETSLDRSPASISDLVAILAQKKSLRKSLEDIVDMQPRSVIINAQTWFRPMASRKPLVIFILAMPIITIGILEFLQLKSHQDYGIAKVDPSHSSLYVESWTRYLPAAIMVCLAIAYNCLDFNVLLFSPLSSLKRGANSERIVNYDLNMQVHFQAIFHSIRTSQYGAALSSIAAVCASVLAIAVSSLYSVETSLYRFSSSFQVGSDVGFIGNIDDGSAAWTLLMMDSLNLSYPTWTYEDIYFLPSAPTDQASLTDEDLFMRNFIPSISATNYTDTIVEFTVPVFRLSLECETLPSDNIYAELTSDLNTDGTVTANITAVPLLSDACHESLMHDTAYPTARFVWEDAHLADPQHSGQWMASYLGELTYFNSTTGASKLYEADYSCLDICAALAFVVVSIDHTELPELTDGDRSLPVTNITVLQCAQKRVLLQANARMHLPQYSVDVSNPPKIVAEPVRPSFYPTGPRSFGNFWIHLQQSFEDYYRLPTVPSNASLMFDRFVQGMIYGADPHDPKDLIGTGQETIERFKRSANRLYSRYAVQMMNSYRVPTDLDPALGYVVDGTITSHNVYHVVQNRGPKIALQVLLALMFVCAGLSYRLVDMRRTLVREPCSIAGKASLILGSELLKQVQDKLQAQQGISGGGEAVVEKGCLDEYTLKLAWWENREERDRIGEIIHGEDDALDARWGIDIVQDFVREHDA